MTLKWHIWHVIDSWSLTAPIRHSVRGRTEFCKRLLAGVIFTPPSPPLSLFWTVDHPPWYKFLSLPNLPLPLKSKTAAIILVKKILSTRSPKLRLLCTEPTFKRSKCLICIICNHNFWPIWFCETFFDANKRNENEPFVQIEHRCTCGQ